MVNQYRRRYLARLAQLLREFYDLQVKDSSIKAKTKNRLDGFIEAGKISLIVNNADLTKLMNEIHYEVFQMSREERLQQRPKESEHETDWSTYDAPTVFRNN